MYIVGRRQEALERAAQAHDPETGGSIIPCTPRDVTRKEEIEALVKEISSKEEKVNLLGMFMLRLCLSLSSNDR